MSEYDIAKALSRIENELILSMIRNMDDHKAEETEKGYEWSMWQAEQLKSLEKYKKVNQKKYKKQFTDINKQIDTIIRTARDAGGMDQEIEILEAIKQGFHGFKKNSGMLQGQFFKLNDRKLEALIKATTQDMEKAETAILRMANDKYRKIIFDAQVYANSGAGTYEKAVDMATHDMLAAGLNCVEYSNGSRHKLSDYADMAIRTASKRAYLQGEGEKRQEWGISTVIINKRGNPCPKCLPFCGKVLIDDVWSGGKKTDGSYPLMSTAIAAGLYHPRCKDSHTTYFPGISTTDDTWTKEELEAVRQENKKEAEKQYAARQAKKFERLAKYSLDGENQEKYADKEKTWENIANKNQSDIIKIKNAVFENENYHATVKSEEKKIFNQSFETAVVIDRRGNVIFRESSGASNFVKFSEEQLSKMKGATLTHNHPSNSTFSFADVNLMAIQELKVIRATGKKRTYQLERRDKKPQGNTLAMDYKMAMENNRKITDADYIKYSEQYNNGLLSYQEYANKLNGLNKKLNNFNSDWLKENAKQYGYRYSVIERR